MGSDVRHLVSVTHWGLPGETRLTARCDCGWESPTRSRYDEVTRHGEAHLLTVGSPVVNVPKSSLLAVSLSARVLAMLDELVASGLYGNDRDAAAEELILQGLRARLTATLNATGHVSEHESGGLMATRRILIEVDDRHAAAVLEGVTDWLTERARGSVRMETEDGEHGAVLMQLGALLDAQTDA